MATSQRWVAALRVCATRQWPIPAAVQAINPANAKTPALVCHGTRDPTVPFRAGKQVNDVLKSAGVPVTFE